MIFSFFSQPAYAWVGARAPTGARLCSRNYFCQCCSTTSGPVSRPVTLLRDFRDLTCHDSFPELVLSLTLVNVPPPTELVLCTAHPDSFSDQYIRLEWVFNNFEELLSFWCHPQDLDELDHALLGLTKHLLGQVSLLVGVSF